MSEIDLDETAWDESCGLTYAEWLQAKNVRPIRHGQSISETTPQGHVITRHADGRQDVTVNL
ncbi:hypothetical protein DQ384_05475 [Sphaerisporangium album]|uniref:Uncharacterized protein n=1 Tax=Sphaerisporangium album TaxID=509200 RepID=A0A367FNL5_9ACTN|nr:hypothetical protein [Sphaerisporangium album]RCG31993.1 hypothetical protein DQ384_05475 [Sphaerisporangium album]